MGQKLVGRKVTDALLEAPLGLTALHVLGLVGSWVGAPLLTYLIA